MSSSVYIIPEERAGQTPLRLVGGKGKNLAKLAQICPSVPPFFIISAAAYWDIARRLELDDRISSLKRSLQENKPIDTFSQAIRELWLGVKLPPLFWSQVWAACHKLSEKKSTPLAVRSSASSEDQTTTSFAGQLKSYLNIKTATQLWSAIRHCWASVWSPAAIYYQYLQHLPFTEVGVAIIIQQLIPASASGVLFTLNPVSGTSDELMIEANWGLGPSLAQGEVTPDNYRISRKKLTVVYQTIGSKKVAVRCLTGTGEGTKRVNTSLAKQRQPVLSPDEAVQLAQLGLRIMQRWGTPQNIEWARYRGKFYLLQCRPITSEDTRIKHEYLSTKDEYVLANTEQVWWTNYFFAERFPQPVSPLSWSILEKYLKQRAFLDPLNYLGIHFEADQVFRLFQGRPYTNLRAFQLLYQSFPSFLLPEDKRHLLSLPVGEQPASGSWLSAILRIAWQENQWLISQHQREWRRFVKHYLAELKKLEGVGLAKLSWKELFNLMDRLAALTDGYLRIHRWSITYADVLYQSLRLMCRNWSEDKDSRLAASLITALEGNPMVEINTALWQMSRHPAGKLPKTELDSFMQRYGHCANNLDLSYPRWWEDSKYILNLIQQLSQLAPDESPIIREQQLRRLREQNTKMALEELLASTPVLFPPWRTHLFKKLLDLTQYFANLREKQRFYWQMSLSRLRQVLLALADKLREQRIIVKDNDIFLLTKAELSAAFSGELSPVSISQLLTKRRREQQQYQLQRLPPLIGPGLAQTRSYLESGQRLRGIGVSPGIAQAPAIVAPNLKYYQPLAERAILVTVSLDPGWTPLLGTVAGLVMEVGGYLSHGSIMAREFGVPAVAGTSGATQLISSGKNIMLDGTQGIVEFS